MGSLMRPLLVALLAAAAAGAAAAAPAHQAEQHPLRQLLQARPFGGVPRRRCQPVSFTPLAKTGQKFGNSTWGVLKAQRCEGVAWATPRRGWRRQGAGLWRASSSRRLSLAGAPYRRLRRGAGRPLRRFQAPRASGERPSHCVA